MKKSAISIDDVLRMSQAELRALVERAAPLDPDALADSSYTGIDLSMPALFHRLAWKYFRKTFHRDPKSGVIRGWNVMVEQTGYANPPAPKRDRRGRARTFGHYELRAATDVVFPGGLRCAHYLDYRAAGNVPLDWPARAGVCPLVAVNAGSSELLLGWEIFEVAGKKLPLPDYWLLVREGGLDVRDVVARPDGR